MLPVVAPAAVIDGVERVAHPVWRVEVGFAPAAHWRAAAAACVDAAAAAFFAGARPDAVDALLVSAGGDLGPLVGFASADTRLRFVEALADAARSDAPMERFARGYMRRSAAAGLAAQIAGSLASARGGRVDWDEDGWPVRWSAVGDGAAAVLAAVPPWAAAAGRVRLGGPRGAE
jgi:hypothetical protein